MYHLSFGLGWFRKWLCKEPKVSVLQANDMSVHKGESWNWNQRSRGSIFMGGLLNFLFSCSKASDANIGIIANVVFVKNSTTALCGEQYEHLCFFPANLEAHGWNRVEKLLRRKRQKKETLIETPSQCCVSEQLWTELIHFFSTQVDLIALIKSSGVCIEGVSADDLISRGSSQVSPQFHDNITYEGLYYEDGL